MSFAYVNGRYLWKAAAAVHIEDRGFQFADSVYEVIAVQNGYLVDENEHLDRLERSLAKLGIPPPLSSRRALKQVIRELLRRNHLKNAALYIQVSRGVAPRDFPAPDGLRPTLVMTVSRAKPVESQATGGGVKVITQPDIRWKRCDIKTVQLVAGVLSKTKAVRQGAAEAWLVDGDGYITEGSASNAWIVTEDGTLITHPKDDTILSGITREAVLQLAKDNGLKREERRFSLNEAFAAKEAFTTSSTIMVRPVSQIDDHIIADGRVGDFTAQVIALYANHVHARGMR